ncbi:MAG: translation initiation factor IF-2 [Prochloraceae cyanobacterium]
MNNGKVRIYELSKELNLDNKDILEICERLNIAVKSHSSTIDTSQAESIRIAAEKYTPTYAGNGKNKANSSPENRSANKPDRSPKRPRKQEILAVHHKRSRPNQAPNSRSENNTPKLLEKPAPPSRPAASQTEINRPPKYSEQPPREQEEDNNLTQPSAIEPKQQQLEPDHIERENTLTADTKTTAKPPQLLSPPVRRTEEDKKKEQKSRKQHSGIKKPQKRSGPIKEKPVQIAASPAKNKPKDKDSSEERGTSTPVSKKPEKQSGKNSRRSGELELKLPKLQKPQKPKPSPSQTAKSTQEDASYKDTEIEPETDLEETEEEIALVAPPKRPQPKPKRLATGPSRSKKTEWVEEDEKEDERLKNKKATKGKRKPVIIDDDDDEFDNADSQNSAGSTAVSISIARPPKPKSKSTQPAQRGAIEHKKPAPKIGDKQERSSDKRKDNKKEVVERPPEKITLPGNLTVRQLSELVKVPETDIIKQLFFKGVPVNITQTIDEETARLVTEELGIEVETPEEKSAAVKETEMLDEADLENLHLRPPVVTIMGHVDHGKTTLLDSIRKTKVAQGEAGGITQHIGAYHVDVEYEGKNKQVVFLDTPGHEAFTAMRARGTRVTDIAILVVAADDGVQPQTREAISHAKAAEVPLIVAINKIDKPGSEPDRIKQELTELGLVPEEWGGDTTMVPVSALKGENLDELLETILLVAEIEELSANPDRAAKGTIIEANLDRARGPVATLLVQNGTLKVGDVIVAGHVFGKIRAMIDDRGEKVEAASPSFAVEVLGLNEVPLAGDEFDVFENEKEARAIADLRSQEQRRDRLQKALSSRRVSLSTLSEQAREGELKELNLILKADVQGSVEAIMALLDQLPQNEVQIRPLLAAPGEVSETDVDLAAASGAVIVGFNTTLASGAREAADREGVDIREYDIIYKLKDDIQGAMEGLLEPEEVEQALGSAEVRAVFTVGRGAVAGCYVQSGKIIRNRYLRVLRNGKVIHQGNIDSLKRVKDDVREVNSGYECGIGCAKFNDWEEGDIIEAYEMVMKRRTLSVK